MNWTLLFDSLLLVYWVVVAIAIIAEDREPYDTIAWIAVLALLPAVGLVIYFFFGRDWEGWLAKQRWVREWTALRTPYMVSIHDRFAAFSAQRAERIAGTVGERVSTTIAATNTSPLLPATSYDIFPDGEEYFAALLDDLAQARESIHMEYFIWECDELTARVKAVLLDRLAHGVDLRILNDFVGSIWYDKRELRELAAAGAQVASDMTQLGRLNYRNHRKITLIDGVIAHTGGFNLGQEYIDGGKRFGAWRDTGLRLTGPIVVELAKLFADRWFEVKRESLYRDEFFRAEYVAVPDDALTAQVVAHGVEDAWESSRRALAIAIGQATRHVWIQSPYFIPDIATYDAMINAALSGVDVRFMMTEHPDKRIAFRAAESYYRPLLRAGGRIFRWTPGFLHAKSVTVDGTVSAVGTMNLDVRSLKLDKELMVWCYDEGVASRCEQIFESDMADCREITLEEVESWGWRRRFGNSAARLGSNVM